MRRLLPLLILLTACSDERQSEAEPAAAAPPPPVAATPAAQPAAMQSEGLAELPTDPEQLKRMVAMGYTVHEDHLHKPGVASCPKMGADPVR